jgi:hypothetical protein
LVRAAKDRTYVGIVVCSTIAMCTFVLTTERAEHVAGPQWDMQPLPMH